MLQHSSQHFKYSLHHIMACCFSKNKRKCKLISTGSTAVKGILGVKMAATTLTVKSDLGACFGVTFPALMASGNGKTMWCWYMTFI